MDTFLIKVKIFNKIEYVKFQKENLDLESFINIALKTFDINTDRNASAIIRDSDDVIIKSDQFLDVVTQFNGCNHFLIKITIISDTIESELDIELKHFLNENECAPLFVEYEAEKDLVGKSIEFLSKKLLLFINDRYPTANRDDIDNVCKSVLTLFPSVKKELIYDAKHKRGFLYQKIVYRKYNNKQSQLSRGIEQLSLTTDGGCNENDALLYFRTCILNKDLDVLKEKMAQTIALREQIIKKRNIDFHKSFPFYFCCPELVIHFVI